MVQYVVPIPGTTSLEHLEEFAAASEVSLSAEELATTADAAAHIRGRGATPPTWREAFTE